jgi:hypothetical protein
MRRSLLIFALIVMLILLDGVANGFHFTTSLLMEVKEFLRVLNRVVGHPFGFLD